MKVSRDSYWGQNQSNLGPKCVSRKAEVFTDGSLRTLRAREIEFSPHHLLDLWKSDKFLKVWNYKKKIWDPKRSVQMPWLHTLVATVFISTGAVLSEKPDDSLTVSPKSRHTGSTEGSRMALIFFHKGKSEVGLWTLWSAYSLSQLLSFLSRSSRLLFRDSTTTSEDQTKILPQNNHLRSCLRHDQPNPFWWRGSRWR